MKGFNSRFEYTGKMISELKDRSINIFQSEKQKKKMNRAYETYVTLPSVPHMYNRNLRRQGERKGDRKNI